MTYAQLLAWLQAVSAAQLADTVTVKIDGEYHPVTGGDVAVHDDVLHAGHCYLLGGINE